MIDLNYLGHDLYKSQNVDTDGFFLCKKCTVKIDYLEGARREYLYCSEDEKYTPNMTCDEFVIKSIIE